MANSISLRLAQGRITTETASQQSGQPIEESRTTEGTYFPASGGSGRGVSLNPRPTRPTQEGGRKAALRHLRRLSVPVATTRPDSGIEESSPCGRATAAIKEWVTWAAEGTKGIVNSLTLLPGAGAQPVAIEPPVVLGQGGYLIGRFQFGSFQTAQEKQQEVSNYKELIPSIEAVAGNNTVVVFGDANSDYPRNLASEGPNSMVTSDVGKLGDARKEKTLHDMEAVFRERGIKTEKVSEPVNFGDVDFHPSSGLLALAHNRLDPGSPLRSANVERQLRRVFGDPSNVILYELETNAIDKLGRLKCYDGDLAMHLMRNIQGQSVALVHKPCIMEQPSRSGMMGRAQVIQTLKDLEFLVIEISAADQAELATNVLSIDGKPGHVLLPSDKISKSLKRKLEANGIVASFPAGSKLLGGKLARHVPMYAIHCLALNMRRPEHQIQREKRANAQKVDL